MGDDVGALRDQRVGGLALAARVEPRVDPDDLGLGLGVDALHPAGERVDAHHDLGDRERRHVAGDVALGHPAGDDAGEVAALVEAGVVDAHVGVGLVAGRVLEVRPGEGLRDLERRVHVAERRGEDQLVAALRELADDPLGVGALGHALDVLAGHLGAERLFHFLATGVVLVGPARVADGAHVDVADFQRLAGLGLRGGGQRQAERGGGEGGRGEKCLAARNVQHRGSPGSGGRNGMGQNGNSTPGAAARQGRRTAPGRSPV